MKDIVYCVIWTKDLAEIDWIVFIFQAFKKAADRTLVVLVATGSFVYFNLFLVR